MRLWAKLGVTRDSFVSLLHCKYVLQYIINFIIYAGRSEQYRKAYVQYIRATFPWLFDLKNTRRERTIFILSPEVKKCSRASVNLEANSIKLDMKLDCTLDLDFRMENILQNLHPLHSHSRCSHSQPKVAKIIKLPVGQNNGRKNKKFLNEPSSQVTISP